MLHPVFGGVEEVFEELEVFEHHLDFGWAEGVARDVGAVGEGRDEEGGEGVDGALPQCEEEGLSGGFGERERECGELVAKRCQFVANTKGNVDNVRSGRSTRTTDPNSPRDPHRSTPLSPSSYPATASSNPSPPPH